MASSESAREGKGGENARESQVTLPTRTLPQRAGRTRWAQLVAGLGPRSLSEQRLVEGNST